MQGMIPFNRPYSSGAEFDHIRTAITNMHLSGNGPFSRRCCEWLEQRSGAPRALLTTSCTAALEMAVLLAQIEPGDEVVMPSYTFVSAAGAVALRRGVPVFVDIREDTLNLDEELIEQALTPRTKAVLPMHYAGVGCEMDAIVELADEHGLSVIEDAAQGILATYRGRPLGSIGDLGALSFHETKNVSCGEGGAILVNRPELVERAEILHEKGTDRKRFLSGLVDKYSWVDLGSSFPLSDVAAAFLWAQMEEAREITEQRLAVWAAYHEAFAALEQRERLRRPIVPETCSHNAHMYYLLLRSREERDRLVAQLMEAGVQAVFHYVPLHSSQAGRRLGRAAGSLARTDDLSGRLIRLPLWPGMTDAQVEHVVEAVHAALGTPIVPA
jgi:dTDP-4-amino-4,6-dideoxygalactose transaminase